MAWTVEVSDYAEKQLRKLDKPVQKRLLDWLEDRIEGCKNPRHFGEALRGELAGLWRYRIGDFRVICEIQDQQLVVLALAVGHRREIYLRRR
ncbi:MAG: type II toxin-antitoxin system mRNA interferase toxin, RelE/StbE family [Desulfuromonas sp.]|nr:MAG: type II toxin-antitoxin system mRNA interferase toxin, RelE/StbE family [Desulfuromonas sp.]